MRKFIRQSELFACLLESVSDVTGRIDGIVHKFSCLFAKRLEEALFVFDDLVLRNVWGDWFAVYPLPRGLFDAGGNAAVYRGLF